MPGAGKSTVGRLLADRLGLPFADTDQIVVAEAGQSVEALFFSEGQAAFRKRERAVIARLLEGPPLVIATGGGAMVEPETASLLLAGATTIWLDVSATTLVDRLKDGPPRPLLAGAGLLHKLEHMQSERRQLYAAADLRLATDNLSPAQTLDRVIDLLSRAGGQ